MAKTTKAPEATENVPTVPTTSVLDSLPDDIAPVRKPRTVDTTFDVEIANAVKDGKYRLTAVTDEAGQKKLRRTLNGAVARLYPDKRAKLLLHENGVYWAVYTPRKREAKPTDA